MIYYFRKSKIIYIILALVVFVTSIMFLMPFSVSQVDGSNVLYRGLPMFNKQISSYSSALIKYFIITILVVLLLQLICSKIASNENQKLINILYENCDAKRFLDEYKHLLRYKKSNILRSNILSTYAVGLSAIGDYESAIEITEELLQKPTKKIFAINRATILINLATYYREFDNNTIRSKKALDEAKSLLKTISPSKQKERVSEYIQDNEFKNMFVDGEVENSLNHFLNLKKLNLSLFRKVSTNYNIAQIYEKRGEFEKQKEHLNFVAHFGNNLAIAEKARHILD